MFFVFVLESVDDLTGVANEADCPVVLALSKFPFLGREIISDLVHSSGHCFVPRSSDIAVFLFLFSSFVVEIRDAIGYRETYFLPLVIQYSCCCFPNWRWGHWCQCPGAWVLQIIYRAVLGKSRQLMGLVVFPCRTWFVGLQIGDSFSVWSSLWAAQDPAHVSSKAWSSICPVDSFHWWSPEWKWQVSDWSQANRLASQKAIIGTWNVHTLHACGKMKELEHELQNYQWDSIRWYGQNLERQPLMTYSGELV